MSTFAWAGIALLGLCFGTGALLIRHIFADEVEDADDRPTARYGLCSAPALALAITGAGTGGAWLASYGIEQPWLVAFGVLGAAASVVAVGLPTLNQVLARRAR